MNKDRTIYKTEPYINMSGITYLTNEQFVKDYIESRSAFSVNFVFPREVSKRKVLKYNYVAKNLVHKEDSTLYTKELLNQYRRFLRQLIEELEASLTYKIKTIDIFKNYPRLYRKGKGKGKYDLYFDFQAYVNRKNIKN